MAVAKTNPFRNSIKGKIKYSSEFQRVSIAFGCLWFLALAFLHHSISNISDEQHQRQSYSERTQHRLLGTQRNDQLLLPNNESVTCVAWRATENCHPKGPLLASSFISNFVDTDLSCHEYVPTYASGYCELVTESGTTIQAFQKGCQHGRQGPMQIFRFIPQFQCHRAVSFLNYKHYAHSYEPPLAIPYFNTSSQTPTRGIVMEIYDKAMPSVYAVIQLLRQAHECHLPIELWHVAGEINENNAILRQILTEYGDTIQTRVIYDSNIQSYMTKPYSIAYSHFDQVLFLDGDTFPTRDPTFLFSTPEFQSTSAIFWKDFWVIERNDYVITQDSLLWELLGIDDPRAKTDMEMESGQLLIDRQKGQQAIKVLLYLAETFEEWLEPLKLVWGDKDLFRVAWYMTKTPFHYITQPPGLAGYDIPTWFSLERVCGVTMVQHDPAGEPLFFHRNGKKLSKKSNMKKMWDKGLEFIGHDIASEYDIEGTMEIPVLLLYYLGDCYHPKPHARDFFREIDYRGSDVEVFEETILDFAKEALKILE